MDKTDYLEYIKNNCNYKMDNSMENYLVKERISKLKNITDESKKRVISQSTEEIIREFEGFLNKNVLDVILKHLNINQNVSSKKPIIGILPTYSVNAICSKSREGDTIIGLHTQLFASISQYNQIQMLFGLLIEQGYPEDECKKFLQQQNQVIVDCFSYPNYSIRLPFISIPNDEMYIFSIEKSMLMEIFIILHELAHIELNHLDNVEKIRINDSDLDKYIRDQQMELEADIQATKWLCELVKNKNKKELANIRLLDSYSNFSLEIFMLFHIIDINTGRYGDLESNIDKKISEEQYRKRFMDCVLELANIKDGKSTIKNTHPSSSVRLLNIIISLGDEEKEVLDLDFLNGMLSNMMFYETFKFNRKAF